MGEFLAVEISRIIQITPQGAWIPAIPTYTEIKSDKCKSTGKKILLDKITWTINGCQFPPNVHLGGSGTINSTAQKVKCELKFPMRETDEGMCNGQFQPPGAPPPPPIPCNCKYKIINAGQNKVKGE